MHKESRIHVAGHRGLVGSAIVRRLRAEGFKNLLLRTHSELDLADPVAVANFYATQRPEYVFLAAAKVGGIKANNEQPAEFIQANLAIQTNVIHSAWMNRVERLLFLGSSCIYPRDCPQPIREEYLLTGQLEPTNRAYAIAKIAGVEMCRAYNAQYGTSFLAAMPTNLYGQGDNYNPEQGHVIPALLRRFCEAVASGTEEVVVWGSGEPLREFLHSDDLAAALSLLMQLSGTEFASLCTGADSGGVPMVNVGSGAEIRVSDLARLIADVVGYSGAIAFDPGKPDGTPRKLLDSRLISSIWTPEIELVDGIRALVCELGRTAPLPGMEEGQ